MMKVIKYIGVVCMLSVLAGCVDDKTIDEFKVLNQVTIEGLQERYSVLLYNRLQCTPVIRTSQNDESNLSYVWYAYTTTTRNEADTLGRERELDVLAEPSILTPGEAYTLALKVTDNTTGVFYREKGNLRCVRSLPKELFFCVKRMVWRKLISSQMMRVIRFLRMYMKVPINNFWGEILPGYSR